MQIWQKIKKLLRAGGDDEAAKITQDELDRVADVLAEDFDSVIIICTKRLDTGEQGTRLYHACSGNWYATYGAVTAWKKDNDADEAKVAREHDED